MSNHMVVTSPSPLFASCYFFSITVTLARSSGYPDCGLNTSLVCFLGSFLTCWTFANFLFPNVWVFLALHRLSISEEFSSFLLLHLLLTYRSAQHGARVPFYYTQWLFPRIGKPWLFFFSGAREDDKCSASCVFSTDTPFAYFVFRFYHPVWKEGRHPFLTHLFCQITATKQGPKREDPKAY